MRPHPTLPLWALLFSTVALIALAGCTPAALPGARMEPPAIDLPDSVRELAPDEALDIIHTLPGLLILDVRTEGEAKSEGKIAGAELHDYLHGEDMMKGLEKIPRDQRCLIYCAIGGRAKLTASRMAAMGFTHLSLLKGGLNAWIAAGKPVQK